MFNKILFSALFIFLWSGHTYATVLFEDSFDATPDWQSAQTQSKFDACGGQDVVWYSNTCVDPATCPPATSWGSDLDGMWDAAYFSSDVDCEGPVNELFIINSSYGRSGKGLRQKVQGNGYGNWHGGRIGVKLPVPQTELYFRMYAKFDEGFTWGADTHGQQKFCDVFSFPPNWPINGDPDMFTRFSAGLNQPGIIYVWYSNRSYDTQYEARLQGAERYSSKYVSYDSETADLWPSDAAWHSYEFRVKLNTLPDVADGEWDFWIDGTLVMSRVDIAWTKRNNWQTGYSYIAYRPDSPAYSYLTPSNAQKGFLAKTTHTSGGAEPNWDSAVNLGDTVADGDGNEWELVTFFKWNNFSLFDNHYLGVNTGYLDEFVQYDDVVISTSYIGPDYVIGGVSSVYKHPSLSGKSPSVGGKIPGLAQ